MMITELSDFVSDVTDTSYDDNRSHATRVAREFTESPDLTAASLLDATATREVVTALFRLHGVDVVEIPDVD